MNELEQKRRDSDLEAKACALVRQYGLLLPRQVKGFMKELAEHLKWNNLKGML
jgi:hypothetical protein